MLTFQVAFYNFWQESSFLTLLMLGKGQGLFFISEKGQSAFLTSKKGKGAILTFKKRQGIFFTFKKKAGCGALRKMYNGNTYSHTSKFHSLSYENSLKICCIVLL